MRILNLCVPPVDQRHERCGIIEHELALLACGSWSVTPAFAAWARFDLAPANGWLLKRPSSVVETDCVAGHVRLELRNVAANYPFERAQDLRGSSPIRATETIRV